METTGALKIGLSTVGCVCTRFVKEGLESALNERARPGQKRKRNSSRILFMLCEPNSGWRHIEVTEWRAAADFAEQMRWMMDEAYEPVDARRIARRLEFHYTSKHGNWRIWRR